MQPLAKLGNDLGCRHQRVTQFNTIQANSNYLSDSNSNFNKNVQIHSPAQNMEPPPQKIIEICRTGINWLNNNRLTKKRLKYVWK